MLEQKHFENAEGRFGQGAGGGGEHGFEPALDGSPIDESVEAFEKIVARSRGNESIQKVHLGNRSLAHETQIFSASILFNRFAEVSGSRKLKVGDGMLKLESDFCFSHFCFLLLSF
jgi:hypothetical protein